MFIWMKVTDDQYELPVAIANSAQELARIVGVSELTIRSAVCHTEKGRRKKSIYVRIDIGEEVD